MPSFRSKKSKPRKEAARPSVDELASILDPTPTTRSRVRVTLGWVLPSISILIALFVVGAAAYLGARPPVLPTLGVSMEPTLHQGDLAILEGVAPYKLEVGDAIAFRTTEEQQQQFGVPAIVLHRIIEINEGRQGLVFTTQGDNKVANPDPDPYRAFEANVIGRMIGSIDKAGIPLLLFTGPFGVYLLVGGGILGAIYIGLGYWQRVQARTRARDALMIRLARALDEPEKSLESPNSIEESSSSSES